MADYKQLCVELTDALDKLNCSFNVPNQSGLVERASAALAEPEPEGPTDEELLKEWRQLMGSPRAILAQPMLDFARAVLARWSRPAPQPVPVLPEGTQVIEPTERTLLVPIAKPVPVSERLPGPGDCTTNPRTGQGQWCWGWVQHDPSPYSGRWRMMRCEWLVNEAKAWLPAHALPVPGEGEA